MEKTCEEIWKNVLNTIKNEIPQESFDLWITSLSLQEIKENRAILTGPNDFFVEWVKNHYLSLLEEAFTQECGEKIDIHFVINPVEESGEPSEEKSIESKENIDIRYTFENFVVGSSNAFAHAASEAVANDPGKVYNPLFIYGGVGLGKTHLLRAIQTRIKSLFPQLKVIYTSAENFTNELIESIRRDKMPEFNYKYRNADALMIDDIQFIAGKESTQEAFFYTFNTLYDNRKQIVISSDLPPKEIPTLEERLRSRFQWGVITDIQPPDLETRVAILRKKAEQENVYAPDDVIFYLASQIKSNIRDLEGAFIRLIAFSALTSNEITIDKAKEILKDIITKEDIAQPITIELIQKVVSKYFHLDSHELKGKRRTDAIALPRQVAMYLARTLTEYSTTDIGEAFGGRDHTTVMYACEKIKARLSVDPYFNALLNKIIQEVKSGG